MKNDKLPNVFRIPSESENVINHYSFLLDNAQNHASYLGEILHDVNWVINKHGQSLLIDNPEIFQSSLYLYPLEQIDLEKSKYLNKDAKIQKELKRLKNLFRKTKDVKYLFEFKRIISEIKKQVNKEYRKANKRLVRLIAIYLSNHRNYKTQVRRIIRILFKNLGDASGTDVDGSANFVLKAELFFNRLMMLSNEKPRTERMYQLH